MLPYLAQGANSAIEDGAVLGHLLGKVKTSSQLPQALKLYEQLRKTRGEAVVRETFKQVFLFLLFGYIRNTSANEFFNTARGFPYA